MLNKIFIILCVSAFVSMLDVVFEKFEMEYYNTKYFKTYNLTIKRFRRNHPYILSVYADVVVPLGNNLKIDFTLYELIAGRYVLTPLKFVFSFCDYLKKDEHGINIFSDYLPKNAKCPISTGTVGISNLSLNFEKIPYIPFTYSSLIARVVSVTKGSVHNDLAFRFKAISVVTQKLNTNKSKKNHKRK